MFALVWTEHALDELADVWVAVDPPTRNRIEAGIHRLNAELRDNPNAVGSREITITESRLPGR
jgi:hypothetical protein